jgi:leucyl-tRNA synthetase
VIWTEAGVEGAHRFIQRVWRLVQESGPALAGVGPAAGKDGDALAVSRAAHKALKDVGDDLERLAFNKAVARIYTLVNALSPALQQVAVGKADGELLAACREALEVLIHIVAPMTPHLAEECWAAIGGTGLIAQSAWPAYDEALVTEDEITLPVQINGKKRGDLTIARDASQGAVEEAVLRLDFVRSAIGANPPRKVIVVPQRIVNVVV